MSKNWYVVHAYSGFEKNVARALQERVNLPIQEFWEILVPTKGCRDGAGKNRSERKFFPGYVLVEMELNDETWHLVKKLRELWGSLEVKRTNPLHFRLRSAAILDRVAAGSEKATPKTVFEPGEDCARLLMVPSTTSTVLLRK